VAVQALEKAGGSYHNSIEIAKHIVDYLKDKQQPVEPMSLLEGYIPTREKVFKALSALTSRIGVCSCVSLVAGLGELCRDTASNVIPYDSIRGLVFLESEYLK